MEVENERCLFCSSIDTKPLDESAIFKEVLMAETGKRTSSVQFKIVKYFCRNCGAVFEKMPEDYLEKYKVYRKDFVENKK